MNRRLIWQLALRYLRGKRGGNAAPILSRISIGAIAVCSAAMVIIFSIFNGLDSTVKELYKAFYPDIKISAAKGKFFGMNRARMADLSAVKGVVAITPVLEDLAISSNEDQPKVITLKGIENSYFVVNSVGDYIAEGDDTVSAEMGTVIMGQHIANELGLGINTLNRVALYYPDADVKITGLNILNAMRSVKLQPAGVFMVSSEEDEKYILAPLSKVQELFNRPGQLSSLELRIDSSVAADDLKNTLKQKLGGDYVVATRFEQNKSLYMVLITEKWVIFAILVLVFLIASFNMVVSLSMLVREKQKDIAILMTMGAVPSAIKSIFLLEGVLWSLLGAGIGIALGVSICLAQQYFHIVKMVGNASTIDAFPVKIVWTDFLLVIATTMSVNLLASLYPALLATRSNDPTLKSA